MTYFFPLSRKTSNSTDILQHSALRKCPDEQFVLIIWPSRRERKTKRLTNCSKMTLVFICFEILVYLMRFARHFSLAHPSRIVYVYFVLIYIRGAANLMYRNFYHLTQKPFWLVGECFLIKTENILCVSVGLLRDVILDFNWVNIFVLDFYNFCGSQSKFQSIHFILLCNVLVEGKNENQRSFEIW